MHPRPIDCRTGDWPVAQVILAIATLAAIIDWILACGFGGWQSNGINSRGVVGLLLRPRGLRLAGRNHGSRTMVAKEGSQAVCDG